MAVGVKSLLRVTSKTRDVIYNAASSSNSSVLATLTSCVKSPLKVEFSLTKGIYRILGPASLKGLLSSPNTASKFQPNVKLNKPY